MNSCSKEISKFDLETDSLEETDSERHGAKTRRQTWASQIDFIMTSVGCAVGLGNIWRFPYLCYKNGGGAFFIPYFLSFILAAAPTYIMEISLGQYMSAGVVHAWKAVPIFQGLGFASQIITLYSNIYYIVVVAWALYYIAVSFTANLPWASCGNPWNTERCFVTGMTLNHTVTDCETVTNNSSVFNSSSVMINTTECTSPGSTFPPVDAVVEYWERGVLQMSRGLEEPGRVVPGLAVALLVAWVLVYLCIFRGVRWTGKIVYFTAIVPYVLLTVIFIRGVTLEGAANGLVFYLRPDFSRILDAQVWIDGGTQVIYSIGVGQGFMITLGSYNKFKTNCVRNGLIIMVINSFTSVFGGLAVFAILGFMAHETQQPIDKVVDTGPGLVFLAYPKAVTQMPLSPLWSVLFFMTILFVGLDSEFAGVEAFLTPFMDRYPKILYKPRNRMIFVGVYCIFCFLIGLSMVTQGGVYLFRLIDYYCASGLVLLAMVFFETLAIGWVYGASRYYDSLEMMIGYRCGPWMRIAWQFTAPLGIFWFQLSTYKPLTFSDDYQYAPWATALGVFFTLSSISCVPAVAVYLLIKSPGSLRERWQALTTPELKKHQLFPGWENTNYKWSQYPHHHGRQNLMSSIDKTDSAEIIE
ncbi:SC6A1-like protein [Mya arenaria]|uniref:Transporter n=1 Tax=Mya arenaria TaxID=6604 RepID=A0ABY7DJ38_MYAAR|nr:SC6A1-like protein [Mya arenaria]